MNVGKYLKKARINKKLTQVQVAKHLGVDDTTISKYENDKSEPDLQTLSTLAELYGLESVNELISGSKDLGAQLIDAANKAKGIGLKQSEDHESNVGRAFLGGSDKYTEEELDLARAAAKAAVDAYRKAQRKKENE